MKDSTRQSLSLINKRLEKEAVTDDEEEMFWLAGLFGTTTAKCLFNTIYFYNGKILGLRRGEHRHLNVNNFLIWVVGVFFF